MRRFFDEVLHLRYDEEHVGEISWMKRALAMSAFGWRFAAVFPRGGWFARTLIGFVVLAVSAHGAPLEFNRDVRPILSENCFQCHGQDAAKREARLRLDERENATRDRDGSAAIVPGKPDDSEVILRITSTDPDEIMPPPDSHKKITPAQIATIRQWIAEGANYEKHWAFIPPRRPVLPEVRVAKRPTAARSIG